MNRIGLGYDIHTLVSDRPLIIGGVLIPCDKGPLGHSDGDPLLHAITDALLGAAALGDIGQHFSDKDPRWEGADSQLFLKEAYRMVQEKGFSIINIDANVHLERPKLGPYFDEIKKVLSRILNIAEDQINLKAKRGEGVDAVGEEKAIVAQAIVLLHKQD